MAALFSPFTLRGVTLKNRIVVSPMCQYQAVEGTPNDWHFVHLAGLARGGAGLVMAEATGVSPEGRITPGCTGLWNDAQAEAFARIAVEVSRWGAVPGVQLAHAGSKASVHPPWGGGALAPDDPLGWEPIGPCAKPAGLETRAARAMNLDDIVRVQAEFVAAARRAAEAGFGWLELHFGHGYLAQSFFSVWENRREDSYGGDLEGRMRFLVETAAAVRAVWPGHLPLAVRLGVTEFDGRGEALQEVVELVRRLKGVGVDLLDASIGFTAPEPAIPWGPAFMAATAEQVGKAAAIPVATSWMITDPLQAEALVAEGRLDLVILARAMLEDPHWPLKAARALAVDKPASATLPIPYAFALDRYGAG